MIVNIVNEYFSTIIITLGVLFVVFGFGLFHDLKKLTKGE